MATTSLLKANPLRWKQTFTYQSTPHRLISPSNNLSFIKHTNFSGTLKSTSSTKLSVKCFVKNSSSSSFSEEEDETPADPIEALLTNTLDDVKKILKTLDSIKESGVTTETFEGLLTKAVDIMGKTTSKTRKASREPAVTALDEKESGVTTETFEGISTKAVDDSGKTTSKTRTASREPSVTALDDIVNTASKTLKGFIKENKTLKALTEPAVAAVLLGVLLTCGWTSESSRTRSYSLGSSSSFLSSDDLWLNLSVMVSIFMLVHYWTQYQHELEHELQREAQKTSVVKLQVALSGMGRSLQYDLNRIAETADTSNSKGWSYILTETTKSLLQHLNYCISCHTSVDENQSLEDGEKCFMKHSTEESEKFDQETLVNVNNVKKKTTSSQGDKECMTEYLVTSILVATQGEFGLPTINGRTDLKDALQKLSSISASKLRGVEVLWTPQQENDILSEKELLEDYSLLKPLRT